MRRLSALPALRALQAPPALPVVSPLPVLPVLLTLAAACTPAPRVAPAPPPPAAAPSTLGMERVMGASPEAVIAILGRPSLDREEGPARHLQFAHGNVCTLDLFFYPRPPAGGRVATHAEARRRDGSPLDPASCLESQFLSRPIG